MNGVDDALDVDRRELAAVVVGQQSGGGLGHYHAGGPGLLEREAVLEDEVGALREQPMRRVGALDDEHHYLRHIVEPACERVRAYASGEHGAVGYLACGQHRGLDVLWHAAGMQRRHFQAVDVGRAREQVSAHCRHLVGLHYDVGAEGFGLDREVHYHRCGRRGVLIGERLNGVGVHAAVAYGVDDALAYQFYSRMRHYRHRRHAAVGYERAHPFCHIGFHAYLIDKMILFCKSSVLRPNGKNKRLRFLLFQRGRSGAARPGPLQRAAYCVAKGRLSARNMPSFAP